MRVEVGASEHVVPTAISPEAAAQVVEREQRVAERDADVALGRGVGEVALQTAGDEGRGERVEQSADESSRFASAFSNRIGLILCGIVDEPVAPATAGSALK